MRAVWTHKLTDPLVNHAEKMFTHRQARHTLIDPDILGEPAWDILLAAFIAKGRESVCQGENLQEELRLTPSQFRRWVGVLVERDLLQEQEMIIDLSIKGEDIMRQTLSQSVSERPMEADGDFGLLSFSSGPGSDTE